MTFGQFRIGQKVLALHWLTGKWTPGKVTFKGRTFGGRNLLQVTFNADDEDQFSYTFKRGADIQKIRPANMGEPINA